MTIPIILSNPMMPRQMWLLLLVVVSATYARLKLYNVLDMLSTALDREFSTTTQIP